MNKYIRQNQFDLIESKGVLEFPIEIFPDNIQHVINKAHESAGFEPQVAGSAILFTVSTIIGLSRKIIVKPGSWEDTPNLWLAVVGRRGTMKTPTVNYCIKPLANDEKEYATRFELEMADWLKKKKEDRNEDNRPRRRQRFSNDTTVEGLIDALQYNWNGMGIYKDELNGFFEEMSRYKAGGNLEFYLSAFSGGVYVKNRKSYDPQTINDIYLSILGSIQPEVLKEIAKSQTKNGMIDRWLYTISSDTVPNTTPDGIPNEVTQEYKLYISTISNNCNSEAIMQWLPGAQTTFFDAVNEMEEVMRDEDCDPKIFTYMSKLKTYFARFIVIMAVMDHTTYIGVDHVYKAKRLVTYFLSTAQETFIGFDNQQTVERIYEIENAKTKKEQVLAVKKHFPDYSISKIAKTVHCRRSYASEVYNGKR